MCPERPPAPRQRGFSIVAAIFLLLVLALLGAVVVSVIGIQQASSQLDLLGVRAYHRGRARCSTRTTRSTRGAAPR
jgi:MSHA biogenesis protein MshP